MNSLSSTDSEDTVLANLLAYCSGHKIWISPSISIRRVPGKGLGVYTSKPLKSGERVVHVPTAALCTTRSVPLSFVGREARKEIPVHALLAAYLAFGLSEARKEEYARWMATWPRVSDFTWTMPMFWPESVLSGSISATAPNGVETEKDRDEARFNALPPWLTSPTPGLQPSSLQSQSKAAKLLQGQRVKLKSHLETISKVFPSLSQSLLSRADPLHWRFIHAWSSVNSRCFYYVRSGQQPPKDSNEAMAMCPGLDLFNHTDGVGCKTTYDKKGFYATTEREYAAGEELLLNYGAHGNDALWCEYGFVMNENDHDGVDLDRVVLPSLTEGQKKILEEASYLGDYSLKPDGICWRTEVASYLGVLTTTQWHRFLEGKYDPDNAEKNYTLGAKNHAKRRKGDANGAILKDGISESPPSLSAKRRQLSWIAGSSKEAEHSLKGLLSISRSPDSTGECSLVSYFSDETAALEAQGVPASDMPAVLQSQARLRHRMCVQRWGQILNLCIAGIDRILDGSPALRNADKEAENGQDAKELLRRVEQFLEEEHP